MKNLFFISFVGLFISSCLLSPKGEKPEAEIYKEDSISVLPLKEELIVKPIVVWPESVEFEGRRWELDSFELVFSQIFKNAFISGYEIQYTLSYAPNTPYSFFRKVQVIIDTSYDKIWNGIAIKKFNKNLNKLNSNELKIVKQKLPYHLVEGTEEFKGEERDLLGN